MKDHCEQAPKEYFLTNQNNGKSFKPHEWQKIENHGYTIPMVKCLYCGQVKTGSEVSNV